MLNKEAPSPPHTIIRLPLQTAAWPRRAEGTPLMLVGDQLSVVGLYLPPVFVTFPPPQTIISLPVQTAVWRLLGEGAFRGEVGSQVSVAGS